MISKFYIPSFLLFPVAIQATQKPISLPSIPELKEQKNLLNISLAFFLLSNFLKSKSNYFFLTNSSYILLHVKSELKVKPS